MDFNFDESIAGQTWVARALDIRELPPIESPWPPHLQSGLDPDYSVYLPEAIGGEVAAAEAFVAAARALESVDAPPPEPPPRAIPVELGCSHSSYRLNLTAGQSETAYSASRERGYSLIVNTGPEDVFIAYGAEADAQGLFLAPDGEGFHELVHGTTSSLQVFCAAAGGFVHIVDGRYDPAHEH